MRVKFLSGLWVRDRVVVTDLYLSRVTVPGTDHALRVATLVRVVFLVNICRAGVWFSFTHRPPQFTFLVSAPRAYEVPCLLSLDHSGHSFYIVLVFPQGLEDSVTFF